MEIEKALVTGGGGFLGKAIVKKLLQQQVTVTSFSRQFYPELEKMGVKQIQGDLSSRRDVADALKGMDVVFHSAAKFGIMGPLKDYIPTNVTGTQNVIDGCLAHSVKQLIYTSSPSVIFNDSDMENVDESVPYPDKYSMSYPETKAMAEKLVVKAAKKSLKAMIIRPHLIWGPEDNHMLPTLLSRAKRLKKVGKKDYLVDTIYVDNAADAHILASEKLLENPSLSGNIYFVSQDEPVAIWKIINAFFDAAGLPPMKGQVSEQTVYIAGTICEFVYKLFNIKSDPPITRMGAKELSTHHWFNISKAKKELGYRPEVSTEEGLRRLKQWYSTLGKNNESIEKSDIASV